MGANIPWTGELLFWIGVAVIVCLVLGLALFGLNMLIKIFTGKIWP